VCLGVSWEGTRGAFRLGLSFFNDIIVPFWRESDDEVDERRRRLADARMRCETICDVIMIYSQ